MLCRQNRAKPTSPRDRAVVAQRALPIAQSAPPIFVHDLCPGVRNRGDSAMRRLLPQLTWMALVSVVLLSVAAYAAPCFDKDATTITHTTADLGTNNVNCANLACGKMDHCIKFIGYADLHCNKQGGTEDCNTCLWWDLYYDDFNPPEEQFWDDMFLDNEFTACGMNETLNTTIPWYRCEAPGYNWHSYVELWNTPCKDASGPPDKIQKKDFST